MADFLNAFAKTSGHEGRYANDPTDRGGETYRGIAREKNPAWYGWEIIDSYKDDGNFPESLDYDDDLQFRVEQFYRDNYWNVNKLDQFDDQCIAEEVYDTGVNMSPRRAAEFLQRSLNVLNRNGRTYADISTDGIVGPQTLRVVNAHPDKQNLLKAMNLLQGYHYFSLCENSPSQERYMNGWLNRVKL